MDAHTVFLLGLKASIALTVFSLGLRTNDGDLTFLLRHRGLLLRSLLSMHVIMPLVTLWLSFALRVPQFVTVTLVALAISPVPPLLPSKAVRSHGHTEYATSLLAMVALLSVVVVPASLAVITFIFGITFRMDLRSVATV